VKKVLRKNQIMITALAVMIAVAGYLNFAGTKIGEEDFISVDGSSSELTYEISDEDMYAISLREDTDGTITDYASAAGAGQDIPSLDTDDVTITENYLNSDMDAAANSTLTATSTVPPTQRNLARRSLNRKCQEKRYLPALLGYLPLRVQNC